MATFAAPVVTVRAIEPIPGADAIELAVVGDYRSVVQKGQFQPGSRAIYLPEGAVLPDDLIERLGLTGRLAGPAKNRIKAIRLRGCLSQGILLDDVPEGAEEGQNFAVPLGVTKYEPVIPASMNGSVIYYPQGTIKYDIENIKAWPDVLIDGEMVEITEKIHGTFCGFSVVPGVEHPDLFGGDGVVYSKGLGAKGLVFQNTPENDQNVYVRAARSLGIHDRLRKAFPGKVVHLLGEIYGKGIQDLTYGTETPSFRAFDLMVDGKFYDPGRRIIALDQMDIPSCPLLYFGPYRKSVVSVFTGGMTMIQDYSQIREGCVIRPLNERRDPKLGRVILKSVSEEYLLRKGSATEYQ